MSTVGLLEPILGGGLRTTNFFNGRLLSAEDLTFDQATGHQARARLGKAIGHGVVSGLEVIPSNGSTPSAPAVTVLAGVAINRMGHVLVLDVPGGGVDVALVRPTSGPAAESRASTFFGDCLPPQPGVYVAGALVYLLVLTPAVGQEGRVPASGLGGVAATCNTRFTIEGVQFRLLQLDVPAADLADADRLRNVAAHACFGTNDAALQALRADAFGGLTPRAGYGLIDRLRAEGQLTDCDVPLGILHWTADRGVVFVDMWAARRRVTRAPVSRWPLVVDDRRLAEQEAMFLQFQDHLDDTRDTHPSPPTVVAQKLFRYLPPVGLVPITALGAPPSFDYRTFFGRPLVHRGPGFIEAASVEPLIRQAMAYAPIDLQETSSVWLYRVRQNAPLPAEAARSTPAPYLIFTSGHMPFQGQARYDEARWEYGTYEP